MSRRSLNILGILILMGITAAVSIFAYIYLVGGSGEPTEPLSAPTLDLSTATPNALETQVAELQATNEALSTALAAVGSGAEATAEVTADAPEATSEATTEATVESESATAEATSEATAAVAAAGGTLYRIETTGSQVSFTLTEDLRGVPTTVVGTTDQVAGDVFVDFANPANSKVGVIRINARTLSTDQEFRNRAIRSEILESASEQYQFIEFTPTSVTGLPDTVAAGSTINFQVLGDLKIRDITQTVTFDVSVTAGDDKLEGTATTTVTRAQYNLQIPNAPGVANVSDDVTLDIKFVAAPVPA